jgi:hypothetical protein
MPEVRRREGRPDLIGEADEVFATCRRAQGVPELRAVQRPPLARRLLRRLLEAPPGAMSLGGEAES